MKKTIATVAALALSVLAAGVFAAPASAGETKRLAKAECREEKRSEPAEFTARYGATGKAAMARCVRDQRREARRDCRSDLRTEPNEFVAEYGGSDRAAIKRCIVDELR